MIRINQSTGQRATKSQIKQALPHLSFADESDLAEFGFPTLESIAQPDPIDADHRVIAGPDEEHQPGQWRQTWVQEPIPPAPAPTQVERRQALKAIAAVQAGLIPELTDETGASLFPTLADDVLAWRNTTATLAEIAEYDHPTWKIDSDLLRGLAAAFGLTDAQIEIIITNAATY